MTTSTPSESFGQRLRRLRKKAGLTQVELAYLVGVHETTIRFWEADKYSTTTENVKRLAEALGVPQAELLEGSPLPLDHWVLTIRIVDEFNEEVIDLNSDFPPIANIILSHKGAL